MVLLCVLLLVAVYFDLRFYRIPNRLILTGIVSGAIYRCLIPGGQHIVSYMAGMGAVFLILIPFYKIHACGGGDVKLLCVCTLFTGFYRGLDIAVCSLFYGGILSVLYLVYHRIFSKELKKERHVIPYAVAIFLGFLTECITGGILWQTG